MWYRGSSTPASATSIHPPAHRRSLRMCTALGASNLPTPHAPRSAVHLPAATLATAPTRSSPAAMTEAVSTAVSHWTAYRVAEHPLDSPERSLHSAHPPQPHRTAARRESGCVLSSSARFLSSWKLEHGFVLPAAREVVQPRRATARTSARVEPLLTQIR